MVQINFGQREVSCKIVFYGPGMSGKTTNLEVIHQKAPKQAVGEMVSIATETDRTLYFDFMPMDLGQVAGMHTKFMLYTVPGQIYYNATRKLVLQGVDGIIFVADSDPTKMAENLESLQNLRDNLAEMGIALEDLPLVLQYNKRDLPGALPVPDMNAQMNPMGVPTFEACARDGRGVFATLKEVSRLVIEKLNREHAPAANRRRTASSLTPNSGSATTTPGALPTTPPRTTPPPLPPRPAAPPPAPRQPPSNTPLGVPQPRGAGSGSHANVPPAATPRPAPQRPQPPMATPRPAAPVARAAPAAKPAPPSEDLSPREKHLAKAKPAPLAQRQGGNVNLGNTDPNLKRYQEQQKSGGAVRLIGWLALALVAATLLLVVLAFTVPAVTALLPMEWQQRIDGFRNPPSAASAAVPPPRTTAPATAAPAAPVSETPAATPAARPAPVVAAPAAPAPAPVGVSPAAEPEAEPALPSAEPTPMAAEPAPTETSLPPAAAEPAPATPDVLPAADAAAPPAPPAGATHGQ